MPTNTHEAGTHGTDVTVANSGWPSGDPLSSVTKGAGGSILQYSRSAAIDGSTGLRMAGRGTLETNFVCKNAPSPGPNAKGAFKFKINGVSIGVTTRILQFRETELGTIIGYLFISATGVVTLRDAASNILASSSALTLNDHPYFVDWDLTADGTANVNGTVHIYETDGTTLVATLSSAAIVAQAAVTQVGSVKYGASVANTNWPSVTGFLDIDMRQEFMPTLPGPLQPQKWSLRGAFGSPSSDPPTITSDLADPKLQLGITHVTDGLCTTATCAALRSKGLTGSWWLGHWISAGVWSVSDATVAGYVDTAVANNDVNSHIYFLGDEPAYSAAYATDVNARIALIKLHDPAAICVVTIGAGGSLTNVQDLAANTNMDGFVLDYYWLRGTTLNRGTPGTEDFITYSLPNYNDARAAWLANPSLKMWGTLSLSNDQYVAGATPNPAHTGVNSRMPSFPGASDPSPAAYNQIKSMIDVWRSDPMIQGIHVYTYDYYIVNGSPTNWEGHLRNRTDLQTELAAQLLATAPAAAPGPSTRRNRYSGNLQSSGV